MRITKHEHACLVIEHQGRRLVVDPGSFTEPLTGLTEVDAVVVTHEHADHWTPQHLTALLDDNPGIPIYAPEGVARAADGFTITTVSAGDTLQAGPFTLRFFGELHAVIHESIPVVDNVGVLVNDSFYYAGDAYTVPDAEVTVLAAPLGAPWLKVGDAMDFVMAVGAQRVFGTHDRTLSPAGVGIAAGRIDWAAQQAGGTYAPLQPGESIDI